MSDSHNPDIKYHALSSRHRLSIAVWSPAVVWSCDSAARDQHVRIMAYTAARLYEIYKSRSSETLPLLRYVNAIDMVNETGNKTQS